MKNRSRSLNSRYLQTTFFPQDFDPENLWSWNLAKLWRKWWEKEIIDRILIFARFSKILTHFEHYFYIGKYTEKGRFSPYRAVLKREYLELGIEFLRSVKSADFVLKFSFIWAQRVFLDRAPPYRLKIYVSNKMRISWASNWIFTSCKKRWLCIEILFHIDSTCIFGPRPLLSP